MVINEKHIENIIAKYIKDGDVIAIGTDELSKKFLTKLALALEDKDVNIWDIKLVPTSVEIAQIASSLGIKQTTLNDTEIDVAIEFVDLVNKNFNYIKNNTTSLIRDKMIAQSAAELIVIAEEKNYVKTLKGKISFEVASFGWKRTLTQLETYGIASLRMSGEKPFKTESGNYIIDVIFDEIFNLEEIEYKTKDIPGVIETSLFIGYADRIILHNGKIRAISRMEYK